MRVYPAICAENTRAASPRSPQTGCGRLPPLALCVVLAQARALQYAGGRGLGVTLAPGIERLEHGREILSLWREKIFIARWMARVEAGRDHAVRLQRLKPRRQRIGSSPCQALLELMKALRPLAFEIAQDQQRPAFANHIESPRHRADLAISSSHAPNVLHSFLNCK